MNKDLFLEGDREEEGIGYNKAVQDDLMEEPIKPVICILSFGDPRDMKSSDRASTIVFRKETTDWKRDWDTLRDVLEFYLDYKRKAWLYCAKEIFGDKTMLLGMAKGEVTKKWNNLFDDKNLEIRKLAKGKKIFDGALSYCKSKDWAFSKGMEHLRPKNEKRDVSIPNIDFDFDLDFRTLFPSNENRQNDVRNDSDKHPDPDRNQSLDLDNFQELDEKLGVSAMEHKCDNFDFLRTSEHPQPALKTGDIQGTEAKDRMDNPLHELNTIGKKISVSCEEATDPANNDRKDATKMDLVEESLPQIPQKKQLEEKLVAVDVENKAISDPLDQARDEEEKKIEIGQKIASPSQKSNDTVVLIGNAGDGESPIPNDLMSEATVQYNNVSEIQTEKFEKIREKQFSTKIQLLENHMKMLQEQMEKQQEKQEKQEKAIEEQEKAREEQEKAREEQEKAREKQEKTREEQEKVREEQEKAREKQGKAREEQEKIKEEQEKAREEQEKAREKQEKAREAQEKAREEQEKIKEEQEKAREEQEKAREKQEKAREEQEKARMEKKMMEKELLEEQFSTKIQLLIENHTKALQEQMAQQQEKQEKAREGQRGAKNDGKRASRRTI